MQFWVTAKRSGKSLAAMTIGMNHGEKASDAERIAAEILAAYGVRDLDFTAEETTMWPNGHIYLYLPAGHAAIYGPPTAPTVVQQEFRNGCVLWCPADYATRKAVYDFLPCTTPI